MRAPWTSLTVRQDGNCIKTSDSLSFSLFVTVLAKSDFPKVNKEIFSLERGMHAVLLLLVSMVLLLLLLLLLLGMSG